MKEKLFLIDGSALLYRSYFAFISNPLTNSKNQNTSAIFGSANSFIKMLYSLNIKNVAISFDRKEETFRHKIDPLYKANRDKMPEELIEQIEPVKEFFRLVKIPEINMKSYEADDVIASLAKKYEEIYDIVIISGDKDFCQILNDNISLYDPSKNKTTTPKDVKNKYGIDSKQFIDYLAIVGDSADNIPGVKGIGPKGAEELLQKYNSLNEIYENIYDIPNKFKNKLITSKDNAFKSYKLATIETNLEISNEYDFTFKEEYLKNVIDFCKLYELNSILKKISPSNYDNIIESYTKNKPINFEAKTIITEKDFNNLLKNMEKYDKIALDTETTGIDSYTAELVGISLCFDNKNAYYIPINHTMAENLPPNLIMKITETLKNKTIIGHNIKFDLRILKHFGIVLNNNLFDTMIAAHLINPERNRHNLDLCAKTELNYQMKPISDLIGKGKNQITFDLVALPEATFYAGEDAFITFLLYQKYETKLKQNNLDNIFYNIEMPLTKILYKMENNGVFIDTSILKKLHNDISITINELTQKIYDNAGEQFNINSTKQLGIILFEKLKLPTIKKTKTGYSTDVSVLEELAKDYLIASLLIEYRQLTKLDSTYISALPKLINEFSQKIHSSFNQTITSTGRLSSSNPNLQNIPIKSEYGKKIRKAFIPKQKNWSILAADYSQIELRIMAILSQDENMIKAFINKEDVHQKTASIIFNKNPEDISKDERRYAKTINFGIIYGMGAKKLSNEINISLEEAKLFIDNYFKNFPKIKSFINTAVQNAEKKGYAETITGRKLPLQNIHSSNKKLKSEAERIAVNMPIQGSAADIIKIAMININKVIDNNPNIKIIIQVHDELVFSVNNEFIDELKNIVKNNMENALPKKYKNIIPLLVDIGVGKNWFEAH